MENLLIECHLMLATEQFPTDERFGPVSDIFSNKQLTRIKQNFDTLSTRQKSLVSHVFPVHSQFQHQVINNFVNRLIQRL
jgi:hypothetical protein